MPTRPSKNVAAKYLEFPPDLVAELEAFAADRRQSFKAVVVDACRRHLKHPPPPPVPQPDPSDVPFPADDAAAKPKRKGGKK